VGIREKYIRGKEREGDGKGDESRAKESEGEGMRRNEQVAEATRGD
jgi:hypothetical protein